MNVRLAKNAFDSPLTIPMEAEPMGIGFTDQQDMMRRLAQDFADHELSAYGSWPASRDLPAIMQKMRALGLMTIGIPVEYGGAGLDHMAKCLVTEEIARGDARAALAMVASTVLGSGPVLTAGTDEQKKWWYSREIEGSMTAFCLSEPGANSGVSPITTTCRRERHEYILNGCKYIINYGGEANLLSVFATVSTSRDRQGMCAFILDKNTPGISIGAEDHGVNSSSSLPIIFKNVRVPVQNRLGQDGDGYKIAAQTLASSQAVVAAIGLGMAQGAFEAASRYSIECYQFGKPIFEFPAIRFMLESMARRIENGRFLCQVAALKLDLGLEYAESASQALAYCSDAASKVLNDAMKIYSAYGYIQYPVAKYLCDTQLVRQFLGNCPKVDCGYRR
jgi:butyryl-CoA dehydrogenase